MLVPHVLFLAFRATCESSEAALWGVRILRASVPYGFGGHKRFHQRGCGAMNPSVDVLRLGLSPTPSTRNP